MRKPMFGCFAFLFLVGACSSNNPGTSAGGSDGGSEKSDATDGGGGGSSDDAHAGCDQYLKCVGDATPDALPVALQAYGPSGTCWGGDGSLDSVCENACASSMAELHKAYPSVASCGPSASSGTDAGSDGGLGLGLTGACETCAESSCSTQIDACQSDPTCAALVSCVNACAPGDTDCIVTCQESYDTNSYTALGDCVQQYCATQCTGG